MKVSEYREQMTERVAVIEAQVIDIYHDIKEIKQLLKEQNGRVRTNEKNIARITTAGTVIAILLGLLQETTMEVNKDSKFTLSIETAISIAVSIFMVVGLWFNLQADIEEAKELPEPPVSRTEYDLKDQMIRNSIMNTEDKVEALEDKVDDIKEDTRSINETLLNMNNNQDGLCKN